MSEEFRKCLKLERDRARSRRESAQGSFESAMLSLDQHVESFDDPGKIAMFSDGGAERGGSRSRGGGFRATAPNLSRCSTSSSRTEKTAMKVSPNWHCATTLKARSQRCATGVT